MPTINEMTFGVEIETAIPVGVIRVGGYHCGIQVPQLPPGWKAEADSSITCPAGHQSCEIVSPILKGADGLRQVKQVCDWLNSVGAKVNRSTGLHVHVGWNGDRDALNRLTHYVANFEKAIFASTGTHSREEGRFCKKIRESRDYTQLFRDREGNGLPWDRYHVLNLTNLGTHKNTIEFRAFAGTTNAVKILGYVRLCLGIVERALNSKRPTRWNGVKVDMNRAIYAKGGEGQAELTRLFYGLGWLKGDTKHVYGDIEAEGLPTIKDCRQKLMSLAAKYDANAEDAE